MTPTPVPGTCTLAELEQETAARLGPFALLEAAGGGQREIVVEVLRSTIDLGGWVDLHLLRRKATQAPDRLARVKSYAPELGKLEPDRTYVVQPQAGEPIEVHHLPPDLLRRAVRNGLERCWMQFRVELVGEADAAPGAPFVPETGPVDLTAYAPWLTLPQRVLGVVVAEAGDAPVPGWVTYGHAGHAWLRVPRGTTNPGLTVVAYRDHFGYVNGADAPGGPTDDDDVLSLPLAYGAAFGAIEAWKIAPDRLESVAAEDRQTRRPDVAAEASRAATIYAPWLFGGGRDDRPAPLVGLRGATRTPAPTLAGAVVNGPAGQAPGGWRTRGGPDGGAGG